jgi:membrane-associated phospholipid phosphatase
VLVAHGTLTGADQYAVDHLMAGLEPRRSHDSSVVDVVAPLGGDRSFWSVVSDLWLYPASVLLSALPIAGCAAVLWRRGRRRAAVLWPGALVVGNAIEVVTKYVLVRPALAATDAGERIHITSFDQALPSGHALRSALIAAAIAYVWPRAAVPAALWAASVGPVLVVAGWHTPTDVLGGLLLAGALVLGVREHAELDRVDRGSFAAGSRDEREPRPVEPQA